MALPETKETQQVKEIPARPPAPEYAHKVVRVDTSSNVLTMAVVTRFVCACGKASLYQLEIETALREIHEHLDLLNKGIVPDKLKCPTCEGKGEFALGGFTQACEDCEGSGIRKDIPSAIGPLGESL